MSDYYIDQKNRLLCKNETKSISIKIIKSNMENLLKSIANIKIDLQNQQTELEKYNLMLLEAERLGLKE